MAGLKGLFTLHEIHKRRAAREVLRDGDEPGGAADEQPSNITREICGAIEVHFQQLFLIRSGS